MSKTDTKPAADPTASNMPERPSITVDLEQPIQRGAQTIDSLQILRPRAGDLRGLLLSDVMQMKTEVVFTLLQRVAQPTLTVAEVNNMDPADLITCAVELTDFLAPKSLTEKSPEA